MKKAGTPIEMAKYKQKEKFMGKNQDDLNKKAPVRIFRGRSVEEL